MPSHTPGPWRCGEQGAHGYDTIRIHAGEPPQTEYERRIEPTIGEVFGFDSETNRANARLIAHVPELLAALVDATKRLADFIGTDCECDNTHMANATVCCLCEYSAAIRAARGE